MFLTSMTGAVALITTRLYGISRREFSTPTERRDDRPRRDARPVRLRALPGAPSSSSPRRSCSGSTGSTRWRPAPSSSLFALVASGAAMLLATRGLERASAERVRPGARDDPGAPRRGDGPDRGLPAGHADARPRDAARLGDRRVPPACCSTAAASIDDRPAARARCWPSRPGCWRLATFRFRRQVTGGCGPDGRTPVLGPDEREDLRPGGRARVGELGGLAVEEAVRGARRRSRAGGRRRPPSSAASNAPTTSSRDAGVGAAEQPEDAPRHRAGHVDRRRRCRCACAPRGRP